MERPAPPAGKPATASTKPSPRPFWLRTLIALGWVTWVLVGLVFWIPKGGRLEEWVQRELQKRMGDAAGTIEVSAIDLDWSARTARIERLVYRDAVEELVLVDFELRFDWSFQRGVFLEQARVGAGSVRISSALIDAVEHAAAVAPERPKRDLDLDQIPVLAIENLKIVVETPEWGDIDVGVLTALLRAEETGQPRLVGRMIPALEGDSGVIFLDGALGADGRLGFRGSARDLPLDPSFLPEGEPFDVIRAMRPKGHLDLEAHGHLRIGRDLLPNVEILATIRGGELRMPWLETEADQAFMDMGMEFGASFQPSTPPSLWDAQAWNARVTARGRWKEATATCEGLFGTACQPGSVAEVWAHLPDVPLREELLRLLGSAPWAQGLWDGLAPRGRMEVLAGVRAPTGWDPTRGEALESAIALFPGGRTSCAYVGGPNPRADGARNLGFPIPLSEVDGLVTHLLAPQFERSGRLSLIDLTARHGVGTIHANGSNHSLPLKRLPAGMAQWERPLQFDLDIQGRGLAVDDELRKAMEGLAGVGGCGRLAEEYGPEGGSLDFNLEMRRATGQEKLAMDLAVDVQGVDLAWDRAPVKLEQARGPLRIVLDGGSPGHGSVSVDLRGRVRGCGGEVRVSGRSQGSGGAPLQVWQVTADQLDLESTHLRERLGAQAPRALEALETIGLKGHLDGSLIFTRSESTTRRAWVELQSAQERAQAVPTALPLAVERIAGRGAMELTWPEPAEKSEQDPVQPVVSWSVTAAGRWPLERGAVPLYLTARQTPEAPMHLTVMGAGVDVEDEQVSATIEALATPAGEDSSERRDAGMKLVEMAGEVDFAGQVGPSAAVVDLTVHLERVGPEDSPLLEAIEGSARYRGGHWRSGVLQARLEETPIVLDELTLHPASEDMLFSARLSADALPLDARHLQHFLDERTLETLLGELECRGNLSFKNVLLELTPREGDQMNVHFKGPVTLGDIFIRLGLPVAIHSAEDVQLDLYYEGERVRAAARIEGLDGEVAGRNLENASMQVTYLDPRLTVEALNGRFEGGRVGSIRLDNSTSSSFFSLDLEEPYPFSFAGEMEGVDVGLLLRGVLNSDFANQGKINADMRLRGSIGKLTGIRGTGRFRLTDSGLWAIPVFQALFSQLGFESAAIFSRFEARFTVAYGKIDMSHLRLKSDLLSLVGSGTVDMGGALHHDLEVRYSLVDKFGPITLILYKIQSGLLRIAVRGDLARPKVVVRGLFSQLFADPGGEVRLPLPAYSKRPRRF